MAESVYLLVCRESGEVVSQRPSSDTAGTATDIAAFVQKLSRPAVLTMDVFDVGDVDAAAPGGVRFHPERMRIGYFTAQPRRSKRSRRVGVRVLH